MSAVITEQKPNLFYRLLQGDCLTVLPNIEGQSVDCIIADLPYNIKIADWDNIENYDEWLLRCFKQFARVLKPNGTIWFFHMDFSVISRLNTKIEKETNLLFKQFITINKGLQSIAGRTSVNLHTFPRATEYLLFYTNGALTHASEKKLVLSSYISSEVAMAKSRTKLTGRDMSQFFRQTPDYNCVSNWTLGLNIPNKEQYEKLFPNNRKHYLDYIKQKGIFKNFAYPVERYTLRTGSLGNIELIPETDNPFREYKRSEKTGIVHQYDTTPQHQHAFKQHGLRHVRTKELNDFYEIKDTLALCSFIGWAPARGAGAMIARYGGIYQNWGSYFGNLLKVRPKF